MRPGGTRVTRVINESAAVSNVPIQFTCENPTGRINHKENPWFNSTSIQLIRTQILINFQEAQYIAFIMSFSVKSSSVWNTTAAL